MTILSSCHWAWSLLMSCVFQTKKPSLTFPEALDCMVSMSSASSITCAVTQTLTSPVSLATLGARLLRSATGPHSSSTACIVLAGRDFPEAVLQKLQGWQLNLQVHRLSNHPATRGLLVYEDDAFGSKYFPMHTKEL